MSSTNTDLTSLESIQVAVSALQSTGTVQQQQIQQQSSSAPPLPTARRNQFGIFNRMGNAISETLGASEEELVDEEALTSASTGSTGTAATVP
eukprot:CAMPEP_0174969280 /NCGR_PEP_ID=MMETSP0004_2-20121128/8659_1 /TAXON_ID=420556 /ORGANISM="Ochromonas sp., Strain CCMP1393" /LENGTH=92 /DNA_ID=CAMNT_0016218721 /DNA_START=48 /DNA_END=323 /DNA_ORIENTATION=+